MNKFKKFVTLHKFHLLAMVIILIVVGVSGYIAFTADSGVVQTSEVIEIAKKDEKSIDKPIQPASAVGGIEDLESNNNVSDSKIVENIIEIARVEEGAVFDISISDTLELESEERFDKEIKIQQPEEGEIFVSIIVGDARYHGNFVKNSTVYDVMQSLTTSSIQSFSFSGKEYSGIGFFVEEINGVKNDNRAGKYWIIYVNGEKSNLGVSNYIIQDNDLIEWKYETTNF